MEEMFEYLVPLRGIFKKKRDPKIMESYKKLDDFSEIVADFGIARPFLNDAVRVGQSCFFPKEKVTIFYLKDIRKAYFRAYGSDSSDDFGAIHFIFRDGSEEVVYKTQETDGRRVAAELFSALNEKGIETAILTA